MTLLAPKADEIYPVGSIIEGNAPPSLNWMLCRGQVLAQASYPVLYNKMENPHPELYSHWNFTDDYDTGSNYPYAERVQWNGSTGSPVWVACGWNQFYSRSTDGITWTLSTMPTAGDWYGPAWNGSVFCALRYGSNEAATSSTGSSWTSRTLSYSYNWNVIVFDGTYFIAIAKDQTQVIRSTDGISWSDTGVLPDAVNTYYGASDGSGTIVLTNSGGSIYYSTDNGATWSKTLGAQGPWFGVEYCNGYFLIATDQGYVGISDNGSDWEFVSYSSDTDEPLGNAGFSPSNINRWRYYDNIYFGVGQSIWGVYSFDLRTFHPWLCNPFYGEMYDVVYNSTSGNLCCFGNYGYSMPYTSKIEVYNESTHFQLPNYQKKRYYDRGLNRYIRVQ